MTPEPTPEPTPVELVSAAREEAERHMLSENGWYSSRLLLGRIATALESSLATIADINEALQNALGDGIEGMERERIERLADDLDYVCSEARARALVDRVWQHDNQSK